MDKGKLAGNTLLLMGSKAYKAEKLPNAITELIDEAIDRGMKIIVGEVPGACRLYQEYLNLKGYENVIVGHAKSIRFNVGNWKTVQYGSNLKERERAMIEACTSAIIVWQDGSSVIVENLELLKRLDKPTFLYEYSTNPNIAKEGWLDPKRMYDPYYYWKKSMKKHKQFSKNSTRD